ncbi:MAG: TetR/AcrR family transcriptional regulator [Bacteriovoracaceae bacterium]
MKNQGNKGLKSRELIIETAIKLISKNGFFQTSIQNIAIECGLSQSAVFHHFKDKTILFEGVLMYVVGKNHEKVTASLLSKDGALERLQKHFEENLKWAKENPDQAKMIILLYYMATYEPILVDINDRITSLGKARVTEYVYAGIREGVFQKNLAAEKAGEVIHQWLVGAILQTVTLKTPTNNPLPEFRKSYQLLLRNFRA